MTLEPGTLLNNRYRIEEIIARGGMGAIYCGIDESLNVKVAIKENLALSADAARQFRKEATILANLRHPNLPRVTDHFTLPDQGQYLVMDYIEGDDLRQRITHFGKLPEDEVILIGIAICDALEYLHTRTPAVLHRDIKPGNIKITPAGQVCLVDFGLAKLTQTGVATTTGAQGLTPGFAPPEQYGQGTEPRSDIYSLGASLYTALSGSIPEDGLSRAMNNGELTSILVHNPALSPRLAAVIGKAMSISPDDRHPSAASFKHALLESSTAVRRKHQQMSEIQIASTVTGVATLASSSAPFPTAPAFGQKRTRTKMALLITIPVLLLGLCAGGAFIFRQSISQSISALAPAASAPSPTELVAGSFNNPTETKEPGSALPTPTLEVPPTLTSTLPPTLEPIFTPVTTPIGGSRGQIAFASVRTGIPQIWLSDLVGGELKQITTLPDGACQPDWSPDGIRLVFISPCRQKQDTYPGSSLFLINSDGSGLTPLVSKPGGDYDPEWSPDGKSIAFTSVRRNNVPYIYVYDLETNTTNRITKTSTNEMRPTWSPDGKWIAFQSSRLGDSQIWLMSVSGEDVREFTGSKSGAANTPSWSPVGDIILFSLGIRNPVVAAREFNVATASIVRISDISPARNASISPDGYWVIFDAVKENNMDIYRMTLNGAMLTRITEDPAQDFDPAWLP